MSYIWTCSNILDGNNTTSGSLLNILIIVWNKACQQGKTL